MHSKRNLVKSFIVGIILLLLLSQAVFAEEQNSPLDVKWIDGPTTVDLGDDLAELQLPETYGFADEEDTKKIMESIGNRVTGSEIGLVVPGEDDWFILFEYEDIGYVKDDEEQDLDADAILESIINGTEEANEQRKKDGHPIVEVLGWDVKPHYDEVTHNLVWSIKAKSEDELLVNYNTRLLGRNGVTSVTLVASPQQLIKIKPELNKIISRYQYKEGKRYSDFDPSKDKVSDYGLMALIAGGAGVAASKAGLFAKILLIFKKVWFIILMPFIAFFNKIKEKFTSKKSNNHTDSSL